MTREQAFQLVTLVAIAAAQVCIIAHTSNFVPLVLLSAPAVFVLVFGPIGGTQ